MFEGRFVSLDYTAVIDQGKQVANLNYKHVLALNPYFGHGTSTMGMFPPTGLEYIVAAMKDLVGKITLLDLRHENTYQDPDALSRFIRAEIDLLCISIRWDAKFRSICDFALRLPAEITTVVGGYKATQEVEYLFDHCPNIDMIVRGEGEEIIKEIVGGKPWKHIRGLSYRENGSIIHNKNQQLPDLSNIAFPDRSLRTHDYRQESTASRTFSWKRFNSSTAEFAPLSVWFGQTKKA